MVPNSARKRTMINQMEKKLCTICSENEEILYQKGTRLKKHRGRCCRYLQSLKKSSDFSCENAKCTVFFFAFCHCFCVEKVKYVGMVQRKLLNCPRLNSFPFLCCNKGPPVRNLKEFVNVAGLKRFILIGRYLTFPKQSRRLLDRITTQNWPIKS